MQILYEDKDCLAVRKPAGMPSQPDMSGDSDVLSTLSARCGVPLFLVHRLDRPVGGVLLFAKHKRSAANLSEAVRSHTLGKEYLCIFDGTLAPEGELKDFLFHDKRKGKAFVADTMRAGVRAAHLSYRILSSASADGGTLSLACVRLHTGRFHQIRVQLASRGCPLFGDGKYGSRRKGDIALYAAALTFPTAKGNMTVCDLPQAHMYPWILFEKEIMAYDTDRTASRAPV